MFIAQITSHDDNLTEDDLHTLAQIAPQLIFVFWSKRYSDTPPFFAQLRQHIPDAAPVGCSSSGDINADGLNDDTIILTAVRFDHTSVRVFEDEIANTEDSRLAGQRLARTIQAESDHHGEPLAGVFSFAPGLDINGSAFVQELTHLLPPNVHVAGGLAGDNAMFERTYTVGPSGVGDRKTVAAALYGNSLRMIARCGAGWQAFGPTRTITRCRDNILMEFDGKPALDLYKKYLGEYADELPASGLFFPLELLDAEKNPIGIYRVVLGMNEDERSLALAGSVELNSYVRLVHASTDTLITSSDQIGSQCSTDQFSGRALAMMVSCVGRKLVLHANVDEEIYAVGDHFGERVTLAGFYSNGEISPSGAGGKPVLNNQMMTVTLLTEDE